MSIDNKVDTTKTEEELMEALKKKADLLGIKYGVNIGFAKLKEKLDLFLAEQDDTPDTTSVGPNKSIIDIEKEAKKPMLVIIKDLDASQQKIGRAHV